MTETPVETSHCGKQQARKCLGSWCTLDKSCFVDTVFDEFRSESGRVNPDLVFLVGWVFLVYWGATGTHTHGRPNIPLNGVQSAFVLLQVRALPVTSLPRTSCKPEGWGAIRGKETS